MGNETFYGDGLNIIKFFWYFVKFFVRNRRSTYIACTEAERVIYGTIIKVIENIPVTKSIITTFYVHTWNGF